MPKTLLTLASLCTPTLKALQPNEPQQIKKKSCLMNINSPKKLSASFSIENGLDNILLHHQQHAGYSSLRTMLKKGTCYAAVAILGTIMLWSIFQPL